jgi:FtsZ-interacting cell division protein ZipA
LKHSFGSFEKAKKTNMETNAWTLVIVAVALVGMVVLILIRNNRDKKEYYESLNAAEDLTADVTKNDSEVE